MLKTIAILVVLAVAAVLAYAATRPDTFRIQRSAVIQAPPDEVFALINDFHRWSAWSPYEKKDPTMKRDYRGSASGVGAVYTWDGNKDIGAGSMEIVESTPAKVGPSRIGLNIDFVRPFKAHNAIEFTLQPRAGGTEVTWAIHGPSPYPSKLMGLFLDVDRMVGRDFEAGLADLKAVAER